MEQHTSPLKGKVILITGATSGIGEAAARRLYSLGADVILHGRKPTRTMAALERIRQAVPHDTGGRMDILVADFAEMTQVYEMAEAFKQRYQRLDVLINNAGAFFAQRQVSPEGLEMTFAVNHLAHHLLTRQLFDIIKASAPSRVITVSSEEHHNAKLDFNDFNLEKNYQGTIAFANSKLCNVLFAYELARKLRRTGNLAMTSNVLHPGIVATRFGQNNGWLVRTARNIRQHNPITRPLMKTPDQGAETIVYLASDPDVAAISGKYWVDKVAQPTSVPSYDHDVAAQLWGLSELLLQRLVPALQPQETLSASIETAPEKPEPEQPPS